MATVWNPSDKTAGIYLENGFHAAAAGSVAVNDGVRAGAAYYGASGEKYLEFTGITLSGSCCWGVAPASLTLGANSAIRVDGSGNVNGGAAALGSSPVG